VRPPYLIKNENYFRNSLSVPLNFNGTLNVGLVLGSSQSKYYLKEKFLKSDTADRTTFDFVRPYFTYQQYNLNHKQFPTEGEKLEVEFSYVEGTEQFKPGSNPFFRNESSHYHHWMNMNIIYEKYFPLNQSIHLGIRLDANYSNKDFFTNYYGTLLNFTDYNPIPHSNSLFLKKFVGNSYIGTTINPIYNINPKFHLRLSLSHFLPYRALKSTANKEAEYHKPLRQHHIMGGASLVYHTVFGPASLNVNYYDKESKNWYFLFNFGFILFNEQGLK
jgi:NTE family protein